MLEFQQFQDKIRRELRARMKFSKDLLELRDKEAKLVRMKRYEEAEKVKMKADLLEEFERNKLEAEVSLFVWIAQIWIIGFKSMTEIEFLQIRSPRPLFSLHVDVSRDPEEGGQAAPPAAAGSRCTSQEDPARP